MKVGLAKDILARAEQQVSSSSNKKADDIFQVLLRARVKFEATELADVYFPEFRARLILIVCCLTRAIYFENGSVEQNNYRRTIDCLLNEKWKLRNEQGLNLQDSV